MCDVTYRRHGQKIEHGNRGKFADTRCRMFEVGDAKFEIQDSWVRNRIEQGWRSEAGCFVDVAHTGCTYLAGFELTKSAVYQFPRARN
jgi:hypothetical protein